MRILIILLMLCGIADAQTFNLLKSGSSSPVAAAGAGCAEATTFLARTSGLDATHTTAYTNLICGLVTDGVWTKFDALYVLATADTTTANLNLVSTNYTITVNGSPTFTADRGYKANSNGDYLDTGFNPTTASSPKFVQDSGHLSGWNNTNAQDASAWIGNSASVCALYVFTDGNFYVRINGGGSGKTLSGNTGHFVGNRDSSNTTQYYQNGASLGTGTDISSAPTNANMFILGTSVGSSTLLQTSSSSIGSSLSSTDVSNYYSRIRTYMTAVGVP